MLDGLLHSAARIAMQLTPPLRTLAFLRWIASACEPMADVDTLTSMHHRLSGRGTCLSRALAIAARCPAAQVVIAVDPLAPGTRMRHLRAHAWVELKGVIVGEDTPHMWCVVGRM